MLRVAVRVEKAETILLRARELHHDCALIEFNLASYASVKVASRRRRLACDTPSRLIRKFGGWRSMMKTFGRCGTGLASWSRPPSSIACGSSRAFLGPEMRKKGALVTF